MINAKEANGGPLLKPRTPGGATVPAAAAPTTNQGTSPSTANATNPIPGADVYLGKENAANLAYENAKNDLLAQRNTLYHQYGLDASGNVDPNNQYGDYQMLLGSQGAALDSARDESAGRGLSGGGLANQAESALRFGQGAEQAHFKNMVDSVGTDYARGLTDAETNRSNTILDARQQAAQDAILNQLFNPVAADDPTTPAPTTTPAAAAKKTLIKNLTAKSVKANKTGATVQKGRGIISIH